MIRSRSRWGWAVFGSLLILVGLALAGRLLRFGASGSLLFGAVVALLPLAYAGYEQWRQALTERLGRPDTIGAALRFTTPSMRRLRALAAIGAAFMMLIAVARPQWGERPREVQRRGIDVVFVVDLSRSMWATDVAPDRLTASVRELDRLLRSMEGDRVGLVVFAADAVVQSPLTSDYGAIRHYLQRIGPDDFMNQGTAIGRAIERATELLVGGNNPSFRRADSQIIVVVTDGEDPVTNPVQAALAAQEQGIDVYAVGVGTPEGSRIPLRNREGSITAYVTARDGTIVTSRLVVDQLQQVAEAGGGEFFNLAQDGTLTAFMEDVLNRYDEEALSSLLSLQYEDRFLPFALMALLLLSFSLLPLGQPRLGRRGSLVLLVLLAGLAGCADGDLLHTVDRRVSTAVDLAKNDRVTEAIDALELVGPHTRGLPLFAYASGWIHEQGAQWTLAQRQYLRALSDEDVAGQVRALTALGNVLYEQQLWSAAIERYRRALTLDPTFSAARTNLQLALLQLFPLCSTLDTEGEPNNDISTALDLPASVYQGDFIPPGVEQPAPDTPTQSEQAPQWLACPNDADWFRIPALGGAKVTVNVEFSRLRPDNGGPPLPDHTSPTSVRIALLGPDGQQVLAVDQGLGSGSQPVDASAIERTLVDVELPANFDPSLFVYLKVEVDQPQEMNYGIEVTVDPPCYALEDELEANDIRATAREMQSGEHQAWTCPGNDDWYRVTRRMNETLFIDISGPASRHRQPASLTVEWYRGDADEPFETTQIETQGPGAHFELWSPDDLVPADLPAGDQPPAPLAEPSEDEPVLIRIVNADEDLQGNYQLNIYRFGPCPDNDRLEANDSPESRHQLTEQEIPPLYYLRLCPGDQDWIEIAVPPEEDEPSEGSGEPAPDVRPFSVAAQALQPWQQFEGGLFDAASSERLAVQTLNNAPPVVEGTLPAMLLAAEIPRSEASTLVVGIAGTPGYYHLTMPEFQQQQQQQQQQQSEQSEQSEDSEDSENADQSEQQEQSDDEQTPDEQQQQDDSAQESPEEQTAEEEAEEDQQEQQAAEPELTEEELDRQALMDLLDSLENDSTNLQVEQALRGQRPVRMEQEW